MGYATFPPNVSNKEAYLKGYIASLFPPFVDNFIKILHEELGLVQENIIPTLLCSYYRRPQEDYALHYWRLMEIQKFLPPIKKAGLVFFLGKVVKEDCHVIVWLQMTMGYGGSKVAHFSCGSGNYKKHSVESVPYRWSEKKLLS